MWRPNPLCIGLVVVCLSLASCGEGGGRVGDDRRGSAPITAGEDGLAFDLADVEGEPTKGGVLRYALDADADGLNPTSSAFAAAGTLMAHSVFDTLAAVTEDGEVVPYLAASIEPNEDSTSWTVAIRSGITFHDGQPLDGEAVVANFERFLNDPLVGLAARPFFVEDAPIELLDPMTVRFNLRDPDVAFPQSLTGQGGMIASPVWLAAALDDPVLNQRPVGTGPFRFERREPDSLTRVVRNDQWWNGPVHLDAIEYRIVSDPAVRADLLASGEVDVMHTDDPATSVRVSELEDIQLIVDDGSEEDLVMLNTAVPPFDDIRAREALARATPLANFRSLIGLDVARPAEQMFTEESPYYNPDVTQVGDDPEGAERLVADYCADVPEQCTRGRIDMELAFAGPSVVATRAADLFEEGWSAGFNVTFAETQQDDLISKVALGDYQATTWRQFGATDPAADSLWLLCRTIDDISLNWPRMCNEDLDAALLEGQATEDEQARAEAYQQVVALMAEDYAYIFLTHSRWTVAAGPHVAGLCGRTAPGGEPLRCAGGGVTWQTDVWLDG